jgi:hypothetical protein
MLALALLLEDALTNCVGCTVATTNCNPNQLLNQKRLFLQKV